MIKSILTGISGGLLGAILYHAVADAPCAFAQSVICTPNGSYINCSNGITIMRDGPYGNLNQNGRDLGSIQQQTPTSPYIYTPPPSPVMPPYQPYQPVPLQPFQPPSDD